MCDQHIKSRDLCERCTYNDCTGKNCELCGNRTELEGKPFCRCDLIQNKTPCPYFDDEDMA